MIVLIADMGRICKAKNYFGASDRCFMTGFEDPHHTPTLRQDIRKSFSDLDACFTTHHLEKLLTRAGSVHLAKQGLEART